MKLRLFFLYLIFFPVACFCEPVKAITFGHGGRLGDNICDYTHAKWLSYKYGIPLLLYKFEYSDQFVFYDVEKHLTPANQAGYKRVIFEIPSQLNEKIKKNILYFVPHGCDSLDEYLFLFPHKYQKKLSVYVDVDWTDKTFRDMMKTLIAPKYPLNLITPPEGIITVALHFRTGGGYVQDTPEMKRGLPLRFPEPEYYIEQMNKLLAIVKHEPIYVHIFTDHPQPEMVRAMFREYFPQDTITFNCREQGNHHNANVLEDLFSMMRFDCLIRPCSHFSITASHLADFKIECYPTNGYWNNDKFVVNKSIIVEKGVWNPVQKIWSPK